ncbi:MAG: hypothetical protein RR387_07945 [Clostridiales bacterium]
MKPDMTKYTSAPFPQEAADQVRKAIVGEKISCAEVRALAEKLGLEYGVIGYIIDQLQIKICDCDLCCFK